MTSAKEYIQSVFETVKARNGHEAEFLQAVEEFFNTLEPVFEKHPEYIEENILARITEPERVISFRVPWVDRDGKVQVNRGYPCSIQLSCWAIQRRTSFPPNCKPRDFEIPRI